MTADSQHSGTSHGFAPSIDIGEIRIGGGAPCIVIAEIGINHNGDMTLAREEIDAAADAGAHGVKFQNYSTEDFVSNRDLKFTYRSQGKTVTEPQYDMFKRCELSRDQLGELKAHCDARQVLFQSTPTSRRGVEDLVATDTPILKNGSDYLGNIDLVRAMGETGLPTVLSTGMATASEIDDAVRAFAQTGNRSLILLHCVSSYPTPADQVNLARIDTLASLFGCPVGFSDHTEGTVAASVAASLGACLIEKHFTLRRDLPGPDHWFSSTPDELSALVEAVQDSEKMIGTPVLGPTESEMEGRREFRLSCVASADIPADHRLGNEDIAFRRPGDGVPPAQGRLLVGRVLAKAVSRGHVFQPEDFK